MRYIDRAGSEFRCFQVRTRKTQLKSQYRPEGDKFLKEGLTSNLVGVNLRPQSEVMKGLEPLHLVDGAMKKYG